MRIILRVVKRYVGTYTENNLLFNTKPGALAERVAFICPVICISTVMQFAYQGEKKRSLLGILRNGRISFFIISDTSNVLVITEIKSSSLPFFELSSPLK